MMRHDAVGVVIVDDHEDIRLLLRMVVESAGDGLWVCGEAATGREAVDLVAEMCPDVVLLDAMLPDIEGLRAATLMREHRPEQAIVLCSAFVDDDVRAQARAVGIDICLTKTQFAEIPAAVRAAAAGSVAH